jgi:hypothetical protein
LVVLRARRVSFIAVNAYAEQGAGLYNLSFGKRTLQSFITVLGGRAEAAVATPIGVLMPRGRIDWRHEFNDGGAQLLDYADLAGRSHSIYSEGWSRDQFQLEIGRGLQLRDGWNMGFDFGAAISSSSKLGTARMSASKKFCMSEASGEGQSRASCAPAMEALVPKSALPLSHKFLNAVAKIHHPGRFASGPAMSIAFCHAGRWTICWA